MAIGVGSWSLTMTKDKAVFVISTIIDYLQAQSTEREGK